MNPVARLETQDLTLRAGGKLLVRGLSLSLSGGENWAILGANGSGKTNLLHALAGLRPVDGGEVRLDGMRIRDLPRRERARQLGILFQETPPGFPATVLETILSGRHPHLGFWEQEGAADIETAQQALAAVGLEGFAERNVTTLSGGERRRMELATLLAQDPSVCLLDEPVNHLDPHYQVLLLRLVSERVRRPGHLNLFVLHDINLALRFCSHGLLLLGDGGSRDGRLDSILDTAVLASVYGCPMREIDSDAGRLYLPS
jgi:iron complex transport system ATP-binding protein